MKSEPGITPLWESARRDCSIRNDYVRQAMAEFFATGIVTLFSTGAGIQSVAAGYPFIYPVLGGVMGLMIAVFVAGGISGAHLNPAVTLSLALSGKVSWFKVPLFWLAQFFGAYVGAGIAAVVYWALTHDDNGDIIQAAGMNFCTAFSHIGSAHVGTSFAEQILTTAILMIGVMALIDEKNMKVPFYLLPFFVALLVAGIALTFSLQSGAPLNPARDLSPRLMALSLGCKADFVMKNGDQQWWLSGFFGPFIGGPVGTFIYILLIGAHVKDEDEDFDEEEALRRVNRDFSATRFIPKAQPPVTMPPPSAVPINQRPYGVPAVGGMTNPAYDGRDDPRYRNGY